MTAKQINGVVAVDDNQILVRDGISHVFLSSTTSGWIKMTPEEARHLAESLTDACDRVGTNMVAAKRT